jgi:hypothetical protein
MSDYHAVEDLIEENRQLLEALKAIKQFCEREDDGSMNLVALKELAERAIAKGSRSG